MGGFLTLVGVIGDGLDDMTSLMTNGIPGLVIGFVLSLMLIVIIAGLNYTTYGKVFITEKQETGNMNN